MLVVEDEAEEVESQLSFFAYSSVTVESSAQASILSRETNCQ